MEVAIWDHLGWACQGMSYFQTHPIWRTSIHKRRQPIPVPKPGLSCSIHADGSWSSVHHFGVIGGIGGYPILKQTQKKNGDMTNQNWLCSQRKGVQ